MEKSMSLVYPAKGETENQTNNGINRKVEPTRPTPKPTGSIQSSTTTTNKGWDIVTSLGDTAMTYLSRILLPDTFELTVSDDDYDVTTSPDVTNYYALADNIVSVEVTIDAEPGSSNPDATAFNGTATVEFDISKMILNTVRNGDYLNLPSTGGYLTATATDAIDGSTGFAMEAWINLDTTANTDDRIISGYSKSNSPVFSFILSSGATKLGLRWGDSTVYSSDITNLTDGNWHHVAVSVASNVATFYVDGLPQDTADLSSETISLDTFCIGYLAGDTASEKLIGKLTDVRVWTASRSETEIQTYMNIDMTNQSGSVIDNLAQLWEFTDDDVNNPTNSIDGTVGTLNGDATVVQEATTTKARYIINFTTTSISLSVSSSLSDTSLEDDFNTALTSLITDEVLPYAQQLKVTTTFQTYSGVITPTNTQFITLTNIYSTTDKPYQTMALSMCYHRTFPSGDPATLFASDSTFMLPTAASTNLIASVSDYQYLFTRQSAFDSFGANFKLEEQSDGTYELKASGNKRIGKWYYFTKLQSFVVYILTGSGIFRNLELTSVILNISKAQMVLQLTPQTRTGDGAQQIERSYTDVDVEVGINYIFFGVVAVIVLAIFVGLGYLFFNIPGAIVGLIIAVILLNALLGFLGILAGKVKTIITNKMENYSVNNVNTNANFTINTITFDQAVIASGLLGAASFDMSVVNSATDTPVVGYLEEDTLVLTFKNDYGDVKFSDDSDDASVITITMPTFLQDDVTSMKLVGTDSWKSGITPDGTQLTLTNQDGGTWTQGEELSFTINQVYCDYVNKAQEPIASGAISASITNTDYVNGTIETAARISLQGQNPNSTMITFSLVNGDDLTIISQLEPPQSQNTSQRTFVQLYEVNQTVNEQTTITWQFGYKNVTKGMEAYIQEKDATSVNYAGTPIQYDADDPDLSTTANIGGIGNNPGIEIQFVVDSEEA